MAAQALVWVGFEPRIVLRQRGIEPQFELGAFYNHWHALVKVVHKTVCFGRQDGERFEALLFGIKPILPKAGSPDNTLSSDAGNCS